MLPYFNKIFEKRKFDLLNDKVFNIEKMAETTVLVEQIPIIYFALREIDKQYNDKNWVCTIQIKPLGF